MLAARLRHSLISTSKQNLHTGGLIPKVVVTFRFVKIMQNTRM